MQDVEKAENPFLTQRPQEIYKTTKINVPAMFGVTSAVSSKNSRLVLTKI